MRPPEEGHKYLLTGAHSFFIDYFDEGGFSRQADPFLSIGADGHVIQEVGYAWDGCSGPAIDDDTNKVPGLEHDGLYHLIRAGILPEDPYRKLADIRLREGILKRCEKFGFFKRNLMKVRAWYFYAAVRVAGHSSATVKRKICQAE